MRNAEAVEQRAQAVGLAGLRRAGDAEEHAADFASRPAALTAESVAMSWASVSVVPPDFEVTTKRVSASSMLCSAAASVIGVEVVVEACEGGLSRLAAHDAGQVPAANLGERSGRRGRIRRCRRR